MLKIFLTRFIYLKVGNDQKEEHMIRAGDVTLKFVSLMDITPLTVKHYIKNLIKYIAKWKEYQATKKVYKEADFILGYRARGQFC